MELLVRLLLAAVLATSAAAKLARPRRSSAAMSTFGFTTPAARRAAWEIAIVAEAVARDRGRRGQRPRRLSGGGADGAVRGDARLGAAAGRAGAPCACFGGGSTVSWVAIARNLVLAVAFAALPSLPESLTTDEWLAVGARRRAGRLRSCSR